MGCFELKAVATSFLVTALFALLGAQKIFSGTISEFAVFGWNAPTISFLGIIFFTVLGTWGLYDQTRKIFDGRSGKTVSAKFFVGFVFMYIAYIIYGVSELTIAVFFHALVRLPLTVYILLGLRKFRRITKSDAVFGVALSAVMAYFIALGELPWMFITFNCIGTCSAGTQLLELYREKDRGVVSIRLISIFNASAIFWVFYGHTFGDMPILVTSIAYVLINSTTMALWFRYDEKA